MKKQLASIALLLGLVLTLVLQASAQDNNPQSSVPIVAKFGLYQLSDAQMKKVKDSRVVTKPVGKKLHGMELLTRTEAACLLHLGSKWPIVYYDPRAEQFQVQYVDIGMKLDLTIKGEREGVFNVNIRPETSTMKKLLAKGELSAYPETFPFVIESRMPGMAWDQTVVLGYVSGLSARTFLSNEGLDTQNDNIVYTLRLERP